MKFVAVFMVWAAMLVVADFTTLFDTNSAFEIKRPATNQLYLVIKSRKPVERATGDYTFHREMDYTVTNVLVESSHEPVLLGKTNGVWLIIFH